MADTYRRTALAERQATDGRVSPWVRRAIDHRLPAVDRTGLARAARRAAR
jgi:hypothetical protein